MRSNSRTASQSGVAIIEVLLILLLVAIVAGTSFYVWHSQKQTDATLTATNKSGRSTVTMVPKSKKSSPNETAQTVNKAAADSPMPAAGSCATTNGTMVTVTLNVDIPSPRCVQVTSNQSLRLTNSSTTTVTAILGSKSVTIAAGMSGTINTPFGSYLQTGDHVVHTGLYGDSGPEVYLPAN